jgi:hypothetical protein
VLASTIPETSVFGTVKLGQVHLEQPCRAYLVFNETLSGDEILNFGGALKTLSTRLWLALATCVCMAFTAVSAFAQLAPNQTNGFGNNKLVTFTYEQNFDCVDQPKLDLDFNGIKAQSDPDEMQTPICQPVTEPTQDPTEETSRRPRISTC